MSKPKHILCPITGWILGRKVTRPEPTSEQKATRNRRRSWSITRVSP